MRSCFVCAVSADPDYYKIKYTPIFTGYRLNPPRTPATGHGIAALDANSVQGAFANPKFLTLTDPFRKSEPVEVLGGTIYLYPVNMTD